MSCNPGRDNPLSRSRYERFGVELLPNACVAVCRIAANGQFSPIWRKLMFKMIAIAAVLSGAAIGATASYAADALPANVSQTAKGKMLVDVKKMTLYVFDKDTAGKSNCNGPCEALWPVLKVAANATPSGDYTIVTRDDGSKQWAYKTKPLYTYSKDTKSGDTIGDAVNGTWHIAKP
jgi:predicted lipoprotein with Yx(FWY)xxD motif